MESNNIDDDNSSSAKYDDAFHDRGYIMSISDYYRDDDYLSSDDQVSLENEKD